MRRGMRLLLLILLSGLFFGSRYYPKIERIEVTGAKHHSVDSLLNLAHLSLNKPFFWVTYSSTKNLLRDPWIAQVRIERRFPHTIVLSILEREPFMTDGVQSYANDGTVLADVPKQEQSTLIQLKGWGPSRLEDTLELLNLLAEFEPKVISYSPAGFTIQYSGGEVFTPSVEALKEHWASFLSQQGTHAYVYPWGVSARHE